MHGTIYEAQLKQIRAAFMLVAIKTRVIILKPLIKDFQFFQVHSLNPCTSHKKQCLLASE